MEGRDDLGVIPARPRANQGGQGGPESLKYYESGVLRRMPFDLMRSRVRGTMTQPGPLPFFGPVTERNAYKETAGLVEWPHRCVVCGRRDHAGIDCTHHIPT